jgi:hypothetical protein
VALLQFRPLISNHFGAAFDQAVLRRQPSRKYLHHHLRYAYGYLGSVGLILVHLDLRGIPSIGPSFRSLHCQLE